ncbi:MAG: Hsp20/alpha crystallin family protein [Candidatus Electrothrix sp. GW3-4]|uniref:Hsp20/alpha crystallin family protein n=1 Tax=Candidatus Electrothrix sp. GW3-4 TaxID=3126740 RepID=UPI0030CD17C0
MNVSIWDPFREMEALLNTYTMPARRKSTAEDNESVETGDWAPVVDILETDNEFVLKVELPGVEKDDVQVGIDNRILTIKGEKKGDDKDKKVHRNECRYGTFIRTFTLPQDVDVDKVEAACKNGVLSLTLTKMEQAKPKQIEVKVN